MIMTLSQEALTIQNHLGRFPFARDRTTRKIAHELMLYGEYSYLGQRVLPVAKSVGAGVYEITVKIL